MFHFGVVIYGTSLVNTRQPHTSHLACLTLTSNYTVFSMAERIRDGGVEECKGFSPPGVPTTNASLTKMPLGSLDLNTRVPNTGTATPQRPRRTEPQSKGRLIWLEKGQGMPREQKDSA